MTSSLRQPARKHGRHASDSLMLSCAMHALSSQILGGRRSLSSNDAAHPLSAANLRPGATSSSAHACDMNASTWPSSAFADRAASNGRGPRVPAVLEAAAADVAAVDDADTSVAGGAQILGVGEPTGMARKRLVARARTAGVWPPHRWRRRPHAAIRCLRAFRAHRGGEQRAAAAVGRRDGGRDEHDREDEVARKIDVLREFRPDDRARDCEVQRDGADEREAAHDRPQSPQRRARRDGAAAEREAERDAAGAAATAPTA